MAPTRRDRLYQLIVEAEGRISRLTFLIAEVTERGHDPSRAEDMVRQFEALIATWNEWRLREVSSPTIEGTYKLLNRTKQEAANSLDPRSLRPGSSHYRAT
ncbi:hypothetical protein [Sphingomonas sp. CROZ-RG-20F-R02-07]|uniref:hypothetical protein n=1 Tax=Sphingomonas sp. CROZ-RG-20F-R02-07 TaxID=2914832 RepID=UPI001F5A3BDC|nr:hypothetical protein [Sphingomonas sp. CROZ-RG-20F-R02-07]